MSVENRVTAEVVSRLRNTGGFVFDLDGSLVLGDRTNKGLQALPGAGRLLDSLDQRGVPWLVMTNGTVRVPASISAALSKAGLEIPAGKIMTPATVAASYFVRRKMKKILVLGIEGVWQPLVDAGLKVVRPLEDTDTIDADAIFIGWYRQIHMDEVEAACNAVWNGASLYAASMVPFFATRGGRALGSSRCIAAMITSITGRRAIPLGKPSQKVLRDAARRMDCSVSELVVLGDDPDLEVKMAIDGGALAVGVHTGIADSAAFAALPPERQPHISCKDVGNFENWLSGIA